MAKRPWGRFPKTFVAKSTGPGTGAAVGIGSVIIGAILAAAGGTVAAIAWPVTLTFVGGIALINAVRSIPKRFKDPSELLGQDLSVSDLAEVDPPVFKLGLIGVTRAGKTNLLDRIGNRKPREERTKIVHTHIFATTQQKLRFLGVLDGAGNEFHQQHEVAENADFLGIVLDHNASESGKTLDRSRLAKHEEFLDQLRAYLQQKANTVKHVEVLLNKRDLWENEAFGDELRKWLGEQVKIWETAFPKQTVASRPFSNRIVSDLPVLLEAFAEKADR